MSLLDRPWFLKTAGVITAGIASFNRKTEGQEADKQPVTIKNLRITKGVTIEANDGTEGSFKGSSAQDLKILQKHLVKIKALLIGRDPFNPTLEREHRIGTHPAGRVAGREAHVRQPQYQVLRRCGLLGETV